MILNRDPPKSYEIALEQVCRARGPFLRLHCGQDRDLTFVSIILRLERESSANAESVHTSDCEWVAPQMPNPSETKHMGSGGLGLLIEQLTADRLQLSIHIP